MPALAGRISSTASANGAGGPEPARHQKPTYSGSSNASITVVVSIRRVLTCSKRLIVPLLAERGIHLFRELGLPDGHPTTANDRRWTPWPRYATSSKATPNDLIEITGTRHPGLQNRPRRRVWEAVAARRPRPRQDHRRPARRCGHPGRRQACQGPAQTRRPPAEARRPHATGRARSRLPRELSPVDVTRVKDHLARPELHSFTPNYVMLDRIGKALAEGNH